MSSKVNESSFVPLESPEKAGLGARQRTGQVTPGLGQ